MPLGPQASSAAVEGAGRDLALREDRQEGAVSRPASTRRPWSGRGRPRLSCRSAGMDCARPTGPPCSGSVAGKGRGDVEAGRGLSPTDRFDQRGCRRGTIRPGRAARSRREHGARRAGRIRGERRSRATSAPRCRDPDALRQADGDPGVDRADFGQVVSEPGRWPNRPAREKLQRVAASTPCRASSKTARPAARSALGAASIPLDRPRDPVPALARPRPPGRVRAAAACGHRAPPSLVASLRDPRSRADAPTPRAAHDAETRARCLRSPPSPSPSAPP